MVRVSAFRLFPPTFKRFTTDLDWVRWRRKLLPGWSGKIDAAARVLSQSGGHHAGLPTRRLGFERRTRHGYESAPTPIRSAEQAEALSRPDPLRGHEGAQRRSATENTEATKAFLVLETSGSSVFSVISVAQPFSDLCVLRG
jgi:hypothetical protein